MCKGSKSVISFLFLFILISLSLFATWNIGNFVDEFEDPTGEHFLFTTVWGTFNNSVTKKSDSPLRVMFYLSDGVFPEPVIQFEPHTYGWGYSVDEFYDDSTATIKLKDDDGIVYSFHTQNTEEQHSWNCLTGKDALEVFGLLKNNNTLKIYISIESYTFNYSLDCSDFEGIYKDFRPVSKIQKNKWELSSIDEDGFWYASLFLNSLEEQYGIHLCVSRYEDREDPSQSFWVEGIYYEDIEVGLFASIDLDEVDKISFSVEQDSYVVSLSDDYLFKFLGLINNFEWDAFNRVLNGKRYLTIDVYMITGGKITFITSASEFLKYTKYPYGL